MATRLSLTEAAMLTRVHVNTLRNAIRRGEVEHSRRAGNGKIFFDRRELTRWASSRVELHPATRSTRHVLADVRRAARDATRTAKS